ncbi:MAG: hypothetical protein ACXVPU_07435 [Bacteroidia bacterium]
MKYSLNFIFFFCFAQGFSQTGMIAYSHDYDFKEGIYLSLDQFKQNSPIPKSAFITGIPKDELDFFSQLLEEKTIVYKDTAGKEVKLAPLSVWGYSQNRTIYINFNKSFNRVNVIGTLFHFTAAVRVVTGYQDPMSYNYGINNTHDEIRQFVFNTQTNMITEFNVKNMELILKDDAELSAQFEALKKRAKADSIFIYLRKYNEKHPLYLPAN